MQKYKIKFGEDAITDEEILHFQDFNQVLKKYETVTAPSASGTRLWNGITLATSILVLSAAYYFLPLKSHPDLPASTQAVQPETLVVPDQNQTADQPVLMQEIDASPLQTAPAPSQYPREKPQKSTSPSQGALVEDPAPKEMPAEKPLKDEPLTYLDTNRKEDVFTEALPVEGYPALYRYFRTNLKYPEQATLDEVSGTVIIGFSINKIGKPSNIQVIEGVNKSIDREAIRLIEHMPPWVPAMVNDIPITTRLVIPITFQLTHLEKKPMHQP